MNAMHEVQLSAGTIRYRDTGGEGPVVLFLHGLLVNGMLWRDVVAELDGVRCVVPDWPLGSPRAGDGPRTPTSRRARSPAWSTSSPPRSASRT